MSSEAVEYVRGISVVKVFQQTIFSFKRFYDSIIAYRDLVTKYTLGWQSRCHSTRWPSMALLSYLSP